MYILFVCLFGIFIGMAFGALLATDGHGNARVSKTKYNNN